MKNRTEKHLALKSGGRSLKGHTRKKNQDFYLIDNITGIFIVADGLGGHSGGEFASQIITTLIHRFLQNKIIHSNGQTVNFQTLIDKAVENAHSHLVSLQKEYREMANMGSTVALVIWNPPSTIHVANIGDSRVYLKNENTIEQLTIDHKGRKKQLTQAIGVKISEGAYLHSKTVKDKNRLLLCTNGLWETLDEQHISNLLKHNDDPNLICRNMVEKAIKTGIPDDITTVVLIITYSSLTDDERLKQQKIRKLIIESLGGKTLSFSKLYKEYEKPVMAFILSRCRCSKDEPLVQDAFQKCWIKIAEKLSTYNPEYPFSTFAFIWAGFAVKELYDELNSVNRREQLQTQMIDDKEEVFANSDVFFECLKVLFSCHKLPHEILVFSFIKLLDYSLDDVIENLSLIPLRDLLKRLKEEYAEESHISSHLLDPYFKILEEKLNESLKALLGNAPKKWYMEIINSTAAKTTLSQYYQGDPAHSISLWINRVKERCIKEF
jgi:RNA polymerase sigma factor (sigma-70 family)